ncbi:MAG: Panacea domain-containing protein, partial [Candidatus Angelobacter sp.]
LKLIKLLYLADRAALLQWGIPVTTDRYVSMDHGPVVSRIYNLITDETPKPVWAEFVSAPLGEYEVELLKEAPTDRLSRAEEKLLKEIYEQFGSKSRWELVEYVHTLPEWVNPHGSALPISIRDILKAAGEDDHEIRAVMRELRAMATADEQLSGQA